MGVPPAAEGVHRAFALGDINQEIENSRSAYTKETGNPAPDKITEIVPALCYENPGESLNLLPVGLKNKHTLNTQFRKHLKLTVSLLAIIFIWLLAFNKNLDNKSRYLARLEDELSRISQEGRPLEEIEQKLMLLQKRFKDPATCLDLLYELHQVMPQETSLTEFNYEEAKQVSLRGSSNGLNPVLTLVSNLENSAAFKKYRITMNYATQKKTQAGESLDFEITCTPK